LSATHIVVHCPHNFCWRIVFHTAVMKEKFGQGREQRGRSTMAGCVSDPE
jgi:hypothetical protein